ncbi:hypothetical protein M2337_000538 [Sphingobium sp. B2D3A]|nr:hypothetical protein [Sphingobium sp. B2D3A]
MELKITYSGRRYYDFELVGLQGSTLFYGEYEVQKLPSSENSSKNNPNSNTVMEWKIRIIRPFSHYSIEETKEIIRESLNSFEYFHGGDRLKGNPLLGAVFHFVGQYA